MKQTLIDRIAHLASRSYLTVTGQNKPVIREKVEVE